MRIRVPLPSKPSNTWKPNDTRDRTIPEIPESILSLGIWPSGKTGWDPEKGPV